MLGIVTVDDMIDAIIEEGTEDAQKFGGMEALDEPYMEIGFLDMLKKRAGWLCVLFLGEMLTASAMQHFEEELEKAIVLTLFIPLIMSSGGNSGSQATSLIIRSLALHEVTLADWWRVALREIPAGLALGARSWARSASSASWPGSCSASMTMASTGCWWPAPSAAALIGIVTFGSLDRLDAALHPAPARLRPGQRLRPVRGDAGRCDRPRHLFRHRRGHPARHAIVAGGRQPAACEATTRLRPCRFAS